VDGIPGVRQQRTCHRGDEVHAAFFDDILA